MSSHLKKQRLESDISKDITNTVNDVIRLQWSQMLSNHQKISEIHKTKTWDEARDLIKNEKKILYENKLPITKWASDILNIPRFLKILTTERLNELPEEINEEIFANRLRFNYKDPRSTMNDERPFIKNALMRCRKAIIIPSSDGKSPVIVFRVFFPRSIKPTNLNKRLQWLGMDGKLQTVVNNQKSSMEDLEKDGMICQHPDKENLEKAFDSTPYEKLPRKHIYEARCAFYEAPEGTFNMPQKAITDDIMTGYMCTVYTKKEENKNGKAIYEIASKLKENKKVTGIHINSIYSARILLDDFAINYWSTEEEALKFFNVDLISKVRLDLPLRFIPKSLQKAEGNKENKIKVNNKGVIITSMNGIPAPRKLFEYMAQKYELEIKKLNVTTAFALAKSTEEAVKLHMTITTSTLKGSDYNFVLHAKATDDEAIQQLAAAENVEEDLI